MDLCAIFTPVLLINKKYLRPLRDEGILRGTTLLVRKKLFLTALDALTGGSVSDYWFHRKSYPRHRGVQASSIFGVQYHLAGLAPHSPDSLMDDLLLLRSL